jgi:entry exclusion lipoprotein TrbK
MAQARRAKALLAALAAIALAGCGPVGGGKSDEDKARDALTELIDARNQRDFAKVCSVIASPALAKFKRAGTTCDEALPRLVPKDTTITIRIDQVRVSGDRATVDATVSQTGGAGHAQTILLVKEAGDWKISQAGF